MTLTQTDLLDLLFFHPPVGLLENAAKYSIAKKHQDLGLRSLVKREEASKECGTPMRGTGFVEQFIRKL